MHFLCVELVSFIPFLKCLEKVTIDIIWAWWVCFLFGGFFLVGKYLVSNLIFKIHIRLFMLIYFFWSKLWWLSFKEFIHFISVIINLLYNNQFILIRGFKILPLIFSKSVLSVVRFPLSCWYFSLLVRVLLLLLPPSRFSHVRLCVRVEVC